MVAELPDGGAVLRVENDVENVVHETSVGSCQLSAETYLVMKRSACEVRK
jgi:hypothetical protein